MPPPADQLAADRRLVTRVDEHGEGLTDWETDLVENCVQRLAEGRELSEKQRAIVERLDEEKVK